MHLNWKKINLDNLLIVEFIKENLKKEIIFGIPLLKKE